MTAHHKRASSTESAAPALIARDRTFGARNYDPLPVVLVARRGRMDHRRRRPPLPRSHERLLGGELRARPSGDRRRARRAGARAGRHVARVLQRQAAAAARARRAAHRLAARAARERRGGGSRDRAQGGAQVGVQGEGRAADRAEIIVCANNFHGRSITIVGFSSEAQYRDGFGPFPPGFVTDSVRRRVGARRGDHAEHGGVPRRADPGRGRHHRAARRLSRRMRAHLPRAQRAPDLRRDPDGARPHRLHARVPARRRDSPTASSSARRSAAACCRCRCSLRPTT